MPAHAALTWLHLLSRPVAVAFSPPLPCRARPAGHIAAAQERCLLQDQLPNRHPGHRGWQLPAAPHVALLPLSGLLRLDLRLLRPPGAPTPFPSPAPHVCTDCTAVACSTAQSSAVTHQKLIVCCIPLYRRAR